MGQVENQANRSYQQRLRLRTKDKKPLRSNGNRTSNKSPGVFKEIILPMASDRETHAAPSFAETQRRDKRCVTTPLDRLQSESECRHFNRDDEKRLPQALSGLDRELGNDPQPEEADLPYRTAANAREFTDLGYDPISTDRQLSENRVVEKWIDGIRASWM